MMGLSFIQPPLHGTVPLAAVSYAALLFMGTLGT